MSLFQIVNNWRYIKAMGYYSVLKQMSYEEIKNLEGN